MELYNEAVQLPGAAQIKPADQMSDSVYFRYDGEIELDFEITGGYFNHRDKARVAKEKPQLKLTCKILNTPFNNNQLNNLKIDPSTAVEKLARLTFYMSENSIPTILRDFPSLLGVTVDISGHSGEYVVQNLVGRRFRGKHNMEIGNDNKKYYRISMFLSNPTPEYLSASNPPVSLHDGWPADPATVEAFKAIEEYEKAREAKRGYQNNAPAANFGAPATNFSAPATNFSAPDPGDGNPDDVPF